MNCKKSLLTLAILFGGCYERPAPTVERSTEQAEGTTPPPAAEARTTSSDNEEAAGEEPAARFERRKNKFELALKEFQAQPLDNAWAGQVAPLVEDVLVQRLPKGIRRSPVECRTSWCSFEVYPFPTGGDPHLGLELLTHDLNKRGQRNSRLALVSMEDNQGVTIGRYYVMFKR